MHRHPTAFVALVVSAMIVAQTAVDVLYASFPNHPWIAGLKQSVTGA